MRAEAGEVRECNDFSAPEKSGPGRGRERIPGNMKRQEMPADYWTKQADAKRCAAATLGETGRKTEENHEESGETVGDNW